MFKYYTWLFLVSCFLYGITDRLLDFGKEGFTYNEICLIFIPLTLLSMVLILKPKIY